MFLIGIFQFEFEQYYDVDFLFFNFIENIDEEELDMFSQEICIVINWDGWVNFVVGVYYEDQELELNEGIYIDGIFGGFVFIIFVIFFGDIDILFGLIDFDQDIKIMVIFGEVIFDIIDILSFDFGVCYFEDEKDLSKWVIVGQGFLGNVNDIVILEIIVGLADLVVYLINFLLIIIIQIII